MPRLRGRGEQGDIVTHVLPVPTLYAVPINAPEGASNDIFQSRSPNDRAEHGEGHMLPWFAAHHGLASEARSTVPPLTNNQSAAKTARAQFSSVTKPLIQRPRNAPKTAFDLSSPPAKAITGFLEGRGSWMLVTRS